VNQIERSLSAVGQSTVQFTPGMALRDVEKNVILEIGIRTLQRKLKQYQVDADPVATLDRAVN
jgi:hypothetical protein